MRMTLNESTAGEIFSHLENVDEYFLKNLSLSVNLYDYANKLESKADRIEIWEEVRLVGLLAFYKLELDKSVYISNISVLKNSSGKGLGSKLLLELERICRLQFYTHVRLEVHLNNLAAIRFYRNHDFQPRSQNQKTYEMEKML